MYMEHTRTCHVYGVLPVDRTALCVLENRSWITLVSELQRLMQAWWDVVGILALLNVRGQWRAIGLGSGEGREAWLTSK